MCPGIDRDYTEGFDVTLVWHNGRQLPWVSLTFRQCTILVNVYTAKLTTVDYVYNDELLTLYTRCQFKQ